MLGILYGEEKYYKILQEVLIRKGGILDKIVSQVYEMYGFYWEGF